MGGGGGLQSVLHFGEFSTGFPEVLSQVIISGLRVPGLKYLTIREVLPGHSLHLLTDSTVDGSLGSLRRCLEENTERNQQSPLMNVFWGGSKERKRRGSRE